MTMGADDWKEKWPKESVVMASELADLCCGVDPDGDNLPNRDDFQRAMEHIMRAVTVGDLLPINPTPFPSRNQFYNFHFYMFEADSDDKSWPINTAEKPLLFRARDAAAWASSRFPLFPYKASDWDASGTAQLPSGDRDSTSKGPTLGQRLDHYRHEAGWTIAELAEKLNIDESSVKNHLGNRARPYPATLRKYVELFNAALALSPPITVGDLRDLLDR